MKAKNKILFTSLVIALLFGISYTSCKKTEVDSDTTSSKNNSHAEDAASGVFRTINEQSDTTTRYRSGCPAIYIDTAFGSTFTRTLTVDYGSSGCEDRKGSFTAVFSQPFRTPGATITVTFNNYYEGENKLDAQSFVITNLGMSPPHNNMTYEIKVVNCTLTSSEGTATWNSTKTVEWTQGYPTAIIFSDDIFSITGTASGVSVKGVAYNVTIDNTKPLVITTNCPWIESGSFTLTPSGKSARTVDFGNGGCDNKATVTIDKKQYDLDL